MQFKGDGQYSETSEAVTIPAQGGIPTSIADLKVTPGDPITIQGTLVGTDGKGIDDRVIALEGKAIENLDIVKSYNTKEGGKFTFTIPGNVLGEFTSHIPKPPLGVEFSYS